MIDLCFCPRCHFIYIPVNARDQAFCPDCGQSSPRPANPKEQAQYEADRKSLLDPVPSSVVK